MKAVTRIVLVALILALAGCETLRTLPLGPEPVYSTRIVSIPPGATIWWDDNLLITPTTIDWRGYEYRGGRFKGKTVCIEAAAPGEKEFRIGVWLGDGIYHSSTSPEYQEIPDKVLFDFVNPQVSGVDLDGIPVFTPAPGAMVKYRRVP